MRRSNAAASRRVASPNAFRRHLRIESLEARCLLATSGSSLAAPQLSSRPGVAQTLYLDFNGHVESRWGSHANVVTSAYDTDGNKASFSAAEVAAIREIWARVAEDYAPFKINVTTVVPPAFGDRVTARVAIGGSYSDWYGASAGGVAYVGGFAGGASNVAYVFSDTLGSGNPRYVAEAASHEAGHLFGLEHHADWNGSRLVTEYDAGSAAWAPIMGVGYYAGRTTWANAPTADGPTSFQDDLSVLAASTNGFGYVPDDYGSAVSAASALPMSGSSVNAAGLIGRNEDRDVFKFTTAGGPMNFSLAVAQYGPNLDGMLELQNSAGRTIVVASPANSFGASLSASVAAGTYYLVVRSTGGYGNVGRYTLQGNVTAAASPPVSQPTPPTPPPADQPEGESPSPPVTTGLRIVDNGNATFASTGTWKKLSGVGYASDTQSSVAGSGASSTWTFSGLAPGQYRVAATWNGSSLNAVDAPFSVSSSSKLLSTVRVNQQRAASTFTSGGAAWQNLGTFTISGNSLTVRLNSAASGRVIADAIRLERVYSTSGGSAFRFATPVDSMNPEVFTTPHSPAASLSWHNSSISLYAGAPDNHWHDVEPAISDPARDETEFSPHADHDDQPHGLPLPEVDAALADRDWLLELRHPGLAVITTQLTGPLA